MRVKYKPQQSPIDLAEAHQVAAVFPQGYLTLLWRGKLKGKPKGKPGHVEFVFDGIGPKIGLRLGGTFFRLVRFHFHAPSEHKVNRRGWPLEVHVVHQNPADSLFAVLGIMVQASGVNDEADHFFEELTNQISKKSGRRSAISIDPRALLPDNRSDFYRYEGSLTTDPEKDNKETVSWVIYREPKKVTAATLRKFIALANCAKVLQPSCRRFVLCSFVPR